jgi:hypothetical protein
MNIKVINDKFKIGHTFPKNENDKIKDLKLNFNLLLPSSLQGMLGRKSI